MSTHEKCTKWEAANWGELVETWRDLAGDVASVEDHTASFRGEKISNQNAGYVFQTWIIEALRLSGSKIEPPFTIPMNPGLDDSPKHEIDGLLIFDWNGFLIEAKFDRVDFSPIARLHVLAEGCPAGTMGLIFAAKGFTQPALDASHILRPMRVLLFDREDIECVLQQDHEPNFERAVHAKWKAGIMYGRPNLAIRQLWSKGANN